MRMKNLKKSSFTLIELIVAIIIVGIAVTSIPMLLNTVSKNQVVAMKEKSFFNAYALLNLMQSQEWDENNTIGDNYKKVLTSPNGNSGLRCTRKGVLELNNSSGAECDNNTTSHIGIDALEDENNVSTFDDIDDFNGYSTLVNDTNISVKVYYMIDDADYSAKNISLNAEQISNGDSNIKFIELNVTDNSTHKEIAILKYFTSNIGMVKIEMREK